MKSLSSSFVNEILHRWQGLQNSMDRILNAVEGNFPIQVQGGSGSFFSFFVSELAKSSRMKKMQLLQYNTQKHSSEIDRIKFYSSDIVIVVPTEREAVDLESDLETVFPESEIFTLEGFGVMPYRAVGKGSVVFGKRTGVLSKMLRKNISVNFKGSPRIFILTQNVFMSHFVPPEYIKRNSFTLSIGASIDTVGISKRLSAIGYTRVPRVMVKGEFSLRGEVLDIFLPCDEYPTRFIFDFDKIESIKEFETDSQTTVTPKKNDVLVYPMREVIWNCELVEKARGALEKYQAEAVSENSAGAVVDENGDVIGMSALGAKKGGMGAGQGDEKQYSLNGEGENDAPKIHLPFTEKALEQMDLILTELEAYGEAEGEEYFYSLLWDRPYSIFDYIDETSFVLFSDYDRMVNAELAINREYNAMYRKMRVDFPVLPPDLVLNDFKKQTEKISQCLFFRTLNKNSDDVSNDSAENLSDSMKLDTDENPSGNKKSKAAIKENVSSSMNFRTPTEEKISPSTNFYTNTGEKLSDSPFFHTQKNQVYFQAYTGKGKTPKNEAKPFSIKFETEVGRSFFGNINYLKEEFLKLKNDGWKIFVYADNENQALRINEILKEFTEPDDKSAPSVRLIPKAISTGFSIPEIKLLVIQENEIFGRRKYVSKSVSKAKSRAIDTFVELNPGDYVVHVNYGIGKFHGIERVKAMGNERDYIKLEYAGEEFAFVPIEQVNLVQRYIGSHGENPKLDKIGSKTWENRKNKVRQSVEDMAEKLINLYSRRKASKGYAFPRETEWQAAFEAAFPYEDTPDQITVTEEIKNDMEKPVPMDRLVCGDVGYGKTEIAMRAAFKAVMGGRQVAFLAPTTILAEQHYETCVERFKNFPVKIAHMSRFVTTSEQKKILFALSMGEVDILIGTHRIIQKDVVFKNLGLMIIDEEQRFGVKDKEKLKVLKNNIDCLTMSATPIPRTLHMSLLKIRDMSLLTTPPQNRQAIETVVDGYSDDKVAKAVRREIERGGQIFYLHNRVESLLEVRKRLEQIVPEVLIDVAHGQMSAEQLDDIFHRFKNGAFHVLIATTIIENGIDIPNVNTIIIDRADMYGVSQLYQLRGRVGRSDRKAYAYLLYPENKSLSEVAMKRLQVISDFTELGSGFKIAMKDMEIRGAGNLLGRDQSGEVYAVGFDLYMRLLNDAINRLTAQKEFDENQNEVLMEMEYTGFIPDSYIELPQIKMEIYKKIAAISTDAEFESVLTELDDRFGPIPDEVSSLLALAEIRIICKKLKIASIKEKHGEVEVEFSKVSDISVDKILKLIKENPENIRLDAAKPNFIFIKIGAIGLKEKSEYIREKISRLY